MTAGDIPFVLSLSKDKGKCLRGSKGLYERETALTANGLGSPRTDGVYRKRVRSLAMKKHADFYRI